MTQELLNNIFNIFNTVLLVVLVYRIAPALESLVWRVDNLDKKVFGKVQQKGSN